MIDAKMRERIRAHLDEINAELDAPVNSDGDSIKDMRAVIDKFNSKKAVSSVRYGGTFRRCNQCMTMNGVNDYQIAAKHADKFDPDSMDFEVWARATIARGMVMRAEYKHVNGGCVRHADKIKDNNCIFDRRADECLIHLDATWTKDSETWTAITPSQYAKETAPEPKLYTQAEADEMLEKARIEFTQIVTKAIEGVAI